MMIKKTELWLHYMSYSVLLDSCSFTSLLNGCNNVATVAQRQARHTCNVEYVGSTPTCSSGEDYE